MPPVRTGVAVYSAEVVAALRTDHEIDVFTDHPAPGAASAHDFIWRHQQVPYDLPVYQLGNSSFHDFIWPYAFRYPGLVVLHDAHLHHARAAQLLRVKRAGDYRAEFISNHPTADPCMAELAVAGFDNYLYYCWPMRTLVIEASRATAVHATGLADTLRDECPGASVEAIRLAHGEPLATSRAEGWRAEIRQRYAVTPHDVLFAVFGALTPEKRLPQILEAFADLRRYVPGARLMLAGAPASHYDLRMDLERWGLATSVVQTGYIQDDELTAHVAACDVSLNLRWPTARETSGPWLRALAAGRPTVIVDLEHTALVPTLDPRTWTVSHAEPAGSPASGPVAVSIDILDEVHSLRLAMRRLATDADLRTQLGAAAASFWQQQHSPERMLTDYREVIARTLARPAPKPLLGSHTRPAHLADTGANRLHDLLEPFRLAALAQGRPFAGAEFPPDRSLGVTL
jgi:glycosyltransferase involved in cell wall biosynthesis